MQPKLKKLLLAGAFFILWWVLRLLWTLVENAIVGWIAEQIGQVASDIPTLIKLAVAWGPPAIGAAICVAVAYYLGGVRNVPPQPAAPIDRAATAPNAEGRSPNVAEWRGHPNYFVWAASCLWINEKPVPKIDQRHRAYPTLQMIKGHLEAGTIRSLDGSKVANSRVSHQELARLARMRQERPEFLFPKRNTLTPQKPQPDMRLEEVVKHITGLSSMPLPIDAEGMKVLHACDEVREKALLGLITVFGGIDWRTTQPADYDRMVRAEIPKDFWRKRKIDVIGFLHPEDNYRGFTCDMTGERQRDDYYGIWFDRYQVEAQWPR